MARAAAVWALLLVLVGGVSGQCTVGTDDCFASCSQWSHVPRTSNALEVAFGCTGDPCFSAGQTRQADTPSSDNAFEASRGCAQPTQGARCFVQAPINHYSELTPALEIEGWSAVQADGTANLGGTIEPLVMSALYVPEAITGNRYCHGNDQAECEGDSERIGAGAAETEAGEPKLACRWIALPEETATISHAIFTGGVDAGGNDIGIRGSIAFEERSVPRLCHTGTINGGRGGRIVSFMGPLVATDDVSCLADMLGGKGVTATSKIRVDLEGLPRSRLGNSGGFGWHAHDFPYHAGDQCSSDRVGGHYAPFGRHHADCLSLISREATCETSQQLCERPEDRFSLEERARVCEAGDFSGKYGKLWPEFDSASFQATGKVNVWIDEGQHGVPLSGTHSLIGRSIAIHAGDDGGTFACATVGAPQPTWSTTLEFVPFTTTNFARTITGSIVFTQAQEDPSGATTMLVNLRNAESTTMKHHLVINEEPCPFDIMESRRTPYDNQLTTGPLPSRGGPLPSGLVERTRVDGLLTAGSSELGVACGDPLQSGDVSYPYSECLLENEFALPPITIANGNPATGLPTAFGTLSGIALSGPESVTDGMSMTVYAIKEPATCEPIAGQEIRSAECHGVDIDRDRAAAEAACTLIPVCSYTAAVLEPAACANFDSEPACVPTHTFVEEAIDGEDVDDVVTAKFVLQIPWELFKEGEDSDGERYSMITAADCYLTQDESCRQLALSIMRVAIQREIAEFMNCEHVPIDRLVYSDDFGNALDPPLFVRQSSSLTGRWSSRCEGNGLAQNQAGRLTSVVVDSVPVVFSELYTPEALAASGTPTFNDFTAVSVNIGPASEEESFTAAELVEFLEEWIVQQNDLLGDQRFNTNHGTSSRFAPMGYAFPSGFHTGAPTGQATPWEWTWANVNPHGCHSCDRCLTGPNSRGNPDSVALQSSTPVCVGVQPGIGQQREGCNCFTTFGDPTCACSGAGQLISGGRPSPLLRHFDASVGIVTDGVRSDGVRDGGLYELHEESGCIFGAVVPGRIEGCCCGCPSFRHLEDAQAFCAGHKDSCGGVTSVGCSYYPRAAQYVLLRDITTYSEPFGTEPSGVISQARRQDITVPVVALQGMRSIVHSGYDAAPYVLWIEFMEGWAPQYVNGQKQFEPSHSIVTAPLDHEADYPFEAETSTVLLSCDIGSVGCTDTCSSAADGVCSDGSIAGNVECLFNTDCSDCGPNMPLPDCTDTCTDEEGRSMVLDGICDEAEGSVTCDIGTDCSDCRNIQICRDNARLINSPTICSGPASSTCTYQCDPGYDIGGEHRCYSDGRYRGGGCAPQDTQPAGMQPFIVDSEETMVCEGRTGDVCEYTCLPGYDEVGAHVAGPDGIYRGGTCQLREISTRTILGLLSFACVLLLGYLCFCSQKLQHQREATAAALHEYYTGWHVREHLALKKKEREIAFDAEKGVEGAVKQAELDSAETAPLQAESAATAAAPAASEPEPEPEPWLEEPRLS